MQPNHKSLLLTLALATTAAAQTSRAVGGNYRFDYGNADIGGSVILQGTATRDSFAMASGWSTQHRVEGVARNEVRVGPSRLEAARVTAAAQVNMTASRVYVGGLGTAYRYHHTGRGDLNVFIGEHNVLSRTVLAGGRLFGIESPRNILGGGGVVAAWTVGPFTVSTTTSITAGASYDIEQGLSSSQQRAFAVGFVQSFATGESQLAFGIPGARCGVESELRFANVRADINHESSPTMQGGTLDYRIEAIRLLKRLFAEVGFSRWVRTIVDVPLYAVGGRVNLA